MTLTAGSANQWAQVGFQPAGKPYPLTPTPVCSLPFQLRSIGRITPFISRCPCKQMKLLWIFQYAPAVLNAPKWVSWSCDLQSKHIRSRNRCLPIAVANLYKLPKTPYTHSTWPTEAHGYFLRMIVQCLESQLLKEKLFFPMWTYFPKPFF